MKGKPGFSSKHLFCQSLDEYFLHLLRQLFQFRDSVSEFIILALQLVCLDLHLQKPILPRFSRTLRRYVVLLPSLHVLCSPGCGARRLFSLIPGAALRRCPLVEFVSFLIHKGIVVIGDGRESPNFVKSHVVCSLPAVLAVLWWQFSQWWVSPVLV